MQVNLMTLEDALKLVQRDREESGKMIIEKYQKEQVDKSTFYFSSDIEEIEGCTSQTANRHIKKIKGAHLFHGKWRVSKYDYENRM